ncbi:MAG: response regulator [Rickettsiales bacterium]
MANVLIIDDDSDIRDYLRVVPEGAGHCVTAAGDGEEGLALMSDDTEVLITDIQMPKVEGLDVILLTKKSRPLLPIIAISGAGPIDGEMNAWLADKTGADDIFTKPFEHTKLLDSIDRLLA